MRARKPGFFHHSTDAGIIQDGNDELIELDFNGEDGLLLVLDGAAALVSLGALEGGKEGVGDGGGGGMWGVGCREAIESHVEAKLERFALERVGV